MAIEKLLPQDGGIRIVFIVFLWVTVFSNISVVTVTKLIIINEKPFILTFVPL